MQIVIDIPEETYKTISEWKEPNPKYAAEYMLYGFVKNGKRIEQQPTDSVQRTSNANKKHIENTLEDAISRQVVLDGADAIIARDTSGNNDVVKAMTAWKSYVESLPSVTVQEKTGRWIRWYEVVESADGKSTKHIPHCKCSGCNCEYDTYSAHFINYCPNCGAKMEVEE